MGGIRLQGVRKVYPGDVVAIEGVDLEVEEGEFVVLVGPSGCGKAGRRDIAMVFQNYALHPHMTVRSNLAYGLRLRRTPKPSRSVARPASSGWRSS